MEKVTVYDLARELGVSVGTIDRAIHNRAGISEETRKKVMDLVRKHNYKPNKAAKYLSLSARKHKVGVIIQGTPEFFWKDIKRGIKSAENELRDFGLELFLIEINRYRTVDDLANGMKKLIDDGVHGIVLVPLNNSAIKQLILDARDKGIPVATLNDDIEDSERVFYIGPHMRQSGRMVGDLMGRFLPDGGNVVTITGSMESYVYRERFEGFQEILQQHYKNIKIVANYTFDLEVLGVNVDSLIKGILKTMVDIRGIYNIDGASLENTGRLIKSQGLDGKVILLGHEIFNNVEKLIAENVIQATISQDPYMQGYQAVKHMFNLLSEKKLPKFDRLYTRIDTILRESIVDRNCLINPYY